MSVVLFNLPETSRVTHTFFALCTHAETLPTLKKAEFLQTTVKVLDWLILLTHPGLIHGSSRGCQISVWWPSRSRSWRGHTACQPWITGTIWEDTRGKHVLTRKYPHKHPESCILCDLTLCGRVIDSIESVTCTTAVICSVALSCFSNRIRVRPMTFTVHGVSVWRY